LTPEYVTNFGVKLRFLAVSALEIIEELPKLTERERRAVRQRLMELAAAENFDIAACNNSALQGAQMLDTLETE
jgi:hypothetical protein